MSLNLPAVLAATPATESESLEEIVVTARRHEERLLDVPIAVSAFTEEELERRQIESLSGLQLAAPSMLVLSDQTNRSTAQVSMRGQFEPMSVPTADSPVGIYLDGVYIARVTGANLRLFDVERAEVLRGPQGTLFGRNTTGGAISIVTRAPSTETGGFVEAEVGDYARLELSGVLNVPVGSGGNALRVAASHREHEGYARNTLMDSDLNDLDEDYARIRVQLTPAAGWAVNLAGDYSAFSNSGKLWTLIAFSPAQDSITAASGHPEDSLANYVDPLSLDVQENRAGRVDSKVYGGSATLVREGDDWSFKSITALRGLDSLARDIDQDGTPYDLNAVLSRHDEQSQFSQEFQWSGHALGERMDWILGALYFLEHGVFDQEFRSYNSQTQRWTDNLPNGSFRNDSIAAFGQAEFALGERWRATAGARFTQDGRQLTSRNARRVNGVETCILVPVLRDEPDLCRATLPERDFSYVPTLLSLDYRPQANTLLYVQWSRGFRAGGYNLRGGAENDFSTFEPEEVSSLELGAKGQLFGNRLRVALAVYRSWFNDIQLIQLVPTALSNYIQNGGEAIIDGGELELVLAAGPLRLSAAFGVVDARYTELEPGIVDVTLESHFLMTPDATMSLAADWPITLSFGTLALHADYAWRDDVPFSYVPGSLAMQPAYGLLNASIGLHLPRSGLDLFLKGSNLADERYLTRALGGDSVGGTPGDPRTWSLAVRYRFGGE